MSIPQVDLFVDDAEKRLVATAIEQRWLSEGPHTKAFLTAIRARLGAKHALPAPNGTLGLFLALLSLDLERGSEIIIPTFTFYASAMSSVFAGLKPVFIDVDPTTFHAKPESIEAAITSRTAAIMPVHIYGQMCDMPSIMQIARKFDLKVVEDAAQAFSVTFDGKAAGTFGDVGVFSFYSDKLITTGEGACLVTEDDSLNERIALLRNQGRPNSGTFVHPSIGMNFRITDMQAAVGRAQIEKLPEIEAGRAKRWSTYMSGLKDVGDLQFMEIIPGSSLIPFRFPILTDRKDELAACLEANQIQTRGFFYPLHLQPKLLKDDPERLPVAEDLYRRGLCLPIHQGLSASDLDKIISTITKFFA